MMEESLLFLHDGILLEKVFVRSMWQRPKKGVIGNMHGRALGKGVQDFWVHLRLILVFSDDSDASTELHGSF